MYKKLGWTIKGHEDYSLEKPELSLHKAELTTELAGANGVDDSASGSSLKRKQSAALPLANPVEDNNAFYTGVRTSVAVWKGWKALGVLLCVRWMLGTCDQHFHNRIETLLLMGHSRYTSASEM